MNKDILRWWLIGYLVGDSTFLRSYIRTASSHEKIVERLKEILDDGCWYRSDRLDYGHRRPLWIFKVKDPEIMAMVERIRAGDLPRISKSKLEAFISGYLDADGYVRVKKRLIWMELMTIDWTLVKVLVEALERLRIKWSISLIYKRGSKLRNKPLFVVHARKAIRFLKSMPSIKIQSLF